MEKKLPDTHQETDPSNIKLNEELDENISSDEPILKDNPNRFVLFPIQHSDIWEMYKKQEASFGTAEEFDLSPDITDWNTKLEMTVFVGQLMNGCIV